MPFRFKLLLIVFLITLPELCYTQFNRFGGGLSFSSGVDFNRGTTGNPGIFAKGYYKINNRFNITPALTVFNRYNKGDAFFKLVNYMFHFDIDCQYGIFKEEQLVVYCLGGINATTVISKYNSLINTGAEQLEDDSSIMPGINVGAGLKMYIDKSFDGVLQAKYVAGGFSQFVISLGAIYHINRNNRKTW